MSKSKKTEVNEIDYLTEDPVIDSQKYMCISFLKPSSIDEKNRDKSISVCGVKVRGVYATYEEAQKRAAHLVKCDQYHNVYVGEVGKWCPFEDDPEKAKDAEYMNKDLNKLMKTYWQQQADAKEFNEVRKQEMINKAIEDVDKKKKENELLDDEVSKKKTKKNKSEKLTELETDLELEKEELENEKKEIDENINLLRRLEEELIEKMNEMKANTEN